jgi:mono/diheme cytochrome c family protein
MGLLEGLIGPPSANQLRLLPYIAAVGSALSLSFLSLYLGVWGLSLVFCLLERKKADLQGGPFSQELLSSGLFDPRLAMALGLLPILALMTAYGQMLYGSGAPVVGYLLRAFLLIGAGFLLAWAFRSRYGSRGGGLLLGLAGFAALLAGYLLFLSTLSFLISFERRWFARSVLDLLFSWNVVSRALVYLAASLGLAGGGVLYLEASSSQGKTDSCRFRLRLGAGLGLLASVSMALFLVWNLLTLPGPSLSGWVVGSVFLALILLAVLCYFSLMVIYRLRPGMGYLVFGAWVLVAMVVSIGDQIALKNAAREHLLALEAQAVEAPAEVGPVEKAEVAREEDLSVGQRIFATRCSACHRFGERLVGPPLLRVLPKYVERPSDLEAFIANPTKKNPDYPPMPKLGLSRKEVRSVAAYLLARLRQEAAP